MMGNKICKLICDTYKPDAFVKGKNQTRAKAPLLPYIIFQSKHADDSEIDPFFNSYASDGKVFFLGDNTSNCGIDLAIDAFQDHTESHKTQKNKARTHNDGTRAGCILLDPKH